MEYLADSLSLTVQLVSNFYTLKLFLKINWVTFQQFQLFLFYLQAFFLITHV